MRMPDVNILIYAHRTDDVCHPFYRGWMERLVNGPEPFALSALVAVAFVRVVTHPAFRPVPTPLPQALATIDLLRGVANCRFLESGPRHWHLFRALCETARAAGKTVADAQHGAVAMEHGCTWVTRDRDFRAFEPAGLRVEILDA
jgi:toxin-antitoxin system PIN domain toxin